MHLTNVEIASHTSKRHLGRLGRLAGVCAVAIPSWAGRMPSRSALPSRPKVAYPQDSLLTGIRIMKLTCYIASVFATGYLAMTPTQAAGAPAGRMSAAFSHGNEHYRYSAPYGGSSYSGYAGIYDLDYSYTPTPEQQATAKQRVEDYLAAVKKDRKRAATHRYISVETLRPTKKQFEDYSQKQRSPRPSQLRCLMVFDTQTRQFVGSGCYVVQSEPSIGEVAKFETVSAEFVGQGNF